MAIFRVTKVRKEAMPLDPKHEHIVGVQTDDGAYHPLPEVVASIERGDEWRTAAAGEPEAAISVEPYCTKPWCLRAPYLASEPGESVASDLEKLPRC